MKHLLLLCLIACSHSATGSSHQAVSQASTCSSAIPDDSLDDTASIQAAINTRCCLGPGVFDIDTPPRPPGGRRRYNMLTVPPDGDLCGMGAATVIRFRGDAGGQDWRGVEMFGGSVHDVTLSTGALVGTVEQTHALHATGPVITMKVHDVVFDHPIRGTLPGGDCIDLVGYAPGQVISDVYIRDNVFAHCDRAGIQIHSGTVRVTVDRNQFLDTGDIDIDSEGTGDSSGWTITRNRFAASPSNQGAYAVALDLVDGVSLTDNELHRGVWLYACTHCVISRNTITGSSGHSGSNATVDAIKGSNDLSITDNMITRLAAQDVGPVIHVGPHGSQVPLNVRITNNDLEQQTMTDIIYTEGVSGLRIDDNRMTYVPTEGNASGVRCMGGAGTVMTNGISIVNNTFNGDLRSATFVAGASNRGNIGSLTAIWNTALSPGLACENMTGVIGPLLLSRNTWPAASCGVPSAAVTVP